jgi:hypothetical protein
MQAKRFAVFLQSRSCAILRGEKIEINCANGGELRDNDFNLGGLAFWHGGR